MEPKEKARELVFKFDACSRGTLVPFVFAKHIAQIGVDEIIKEYKGIKKYYGKAFSRINYWEEVKQEIEKV